MRIRAFTSFVKHMVAKFFHFKVAGSFVIKYRFQNKTLTRTNNDKRVLAICRKNVKSKELLCQYNLFLLGIVQVCKLYSDELIRTPYFLWS